MSLVCEHKPIFDTAAALEDIWILRVVVSFADDVRGTELEFLGERGGACPLNVVFVVIGASVLATHDVDFIQAAGGATDAFELACVLACAMEGCWRLLSQAYLWKCAHAPMRCLQVFAQREALHI